MEEGFRLAGAYIEVNLRDKTDRDLDAIKAKIEKLSGDIDLKVNTKPAEREVDGLKEKVEKSEPTLRVKANNPLDAAWKAKVDAEIKSVANQAIKIPLNSDTAKFHAEIEKTLSALSKSSKVIVGTDLSSQDKARLKAELNEFLAEAGRTAKVRVQAEADKASAEKAAEEISRLATAVDPKVKVGAESDHVSAAKAGKDVADEASAAADQQGRGGMTRTGRLLALAAAAGVTAGGPLIAGAGVLAIGVGVAGMVAAIEKSNPQVQQAWKSFVDSGKSTLTTAFQGITPIIVGTIGQWQAAIQHLGPVFGQLASSSVPFIRQMSDALVMATNTGLRGMTTAMQQSQPIIGALASGVQTLTQDFMQMLNHLNFAQAGQGLHMLFDAVGGLLPMLGSILNALMPLGNAILGAFVPLENIISKLSSGLAPVIRVVAGDVQTLSSALSGMSGFLGAVGPAAIAAFAAFKGMQIAKTGVEGLSTGIFNMGMSIERVAPKLGGMVGSAASMASEFAGPLAAGLVGVIALLGLLSDAETKTKVTSDDLSKAGGDLTSALKESHGVISQGVVDALQNEDAFKKVTAQTDKLGISHMEVAKAILQGGPARDHLIAQLGGIEKAGTTVGTGALSTTKHVLTGNADAAQQASSGFKGLASTFDKSKASAADQNNIMAALGITTGSATTAFKMNAAQTSAVAAVAKSAGLSVGELSGAFATAGVKTAQFTGDMGGALSGLAGVTQAGIDMASGFKQADQQVASSRQGLSSANYSYQQSLQGVRDANYGVKQAEQGVADASHGLMLAQRGVTDANHALAQAEQGVTDANHGVIMSERGVADALHSRHEAVLQVTASVQAVRDAEAGVTIAEDTLAKAQLSERDAQLALTAARKAAREELISLRLQLQDQVASEEQARLSLFDQEKAAKALGVTLANAKQIMAQPITDHNEARIKAALALVQAQNGLNDTMNTGKNLRSQAAAAEKAGINGATQVIAAQKALLTSIDQVKSAQQGVVKSVQAVHAAQQQLANSQYALVKANQAVGDANYALSKSHQAVRDANYAVSQAARGVRDAQYGVVKAHQAVESANHSLVKSHEAVATAEHGVQQAAQAVTAAQKALNTATSAASRSLDVHTEAGSKNVGMLIKTRDNLLKLEPKNQAYNDLIRDMAKAYGISNDAAETQLKKLGLIPRNFQSVSDKARALAQDQRDLAKAIHDVGLAMDGNQRAMRTFYNSPSHIAAEAAGTNFGGQTNRAVGGIIRGPGTGTSDSIVAHVSNGEYVIKADSVSKYGLGILDAINAGDFADGGQIGAAQIIATPPAVLASATQQTASLASASQVLGGTEVGAAIGVNALSTGLTKFIGTANSGNAVDNTLTATLEGHLTPALKSNTNATVQTDQAHRNLFATQAPLTAAINTTATHVQKNWNDIRQNVTTNSQGVQQQQYSMQAFLASSWNYISSTISSNEKKVEAQQYATQGFMGSSWGYISNAVSSSVTHQQGSLTSLNSSLVQSSRAMQAFERQARASFGAVYTDVYNPIHSAVAGPINKGIIGAWNSLDKQFSLGKHVTGVPMFADGGRVYGPGHGTSDDVHAMLSNGEFVVKEKVARYAMPFLHALNDEQAEALQATGGPTAKVPGYAQGGVVADTGSQANAAIARGQAAINQMKGKRYIWGGASPEGADCSGLVAIITNALRGESNIFHRIGQAETQPWPGFVSGLHSAFGTGFNSHHTASTLNGVNSEARDFGIPILVNSEVAGKTAAGAKSAQFTGTASLPVVGGKFIGGDGSGFDSVAAVHAAFGGVNKLVAQVRGRYAGNIAAQDSTGIAVEASAAVQQKAVDKLSAMMSTVGGSVPAAHGNALAAQKYAKSMLGKFGFGPDQWSPLLQMWQRESNWDANKVNGGSGAYGIPQANPSGGQGHPYALGDYANQVNWGLNYIKQRYHTPAAAWAFWNSHSPGWYDHGGKSKVQTGGGKLPPGLTVGALANGTGKSEMVRTAPEEDALLTELKRMNEKLDKIGMRPIVNQTVNAAGTLDEVVTASARIVTQQLQGAF